MVPRRGDQVDREDGVGLDRNVERRYMEAATEAGLEREASEGDLDDSFTTTVCERARPRRPDGHGESWSVLQANMTSFENGWSTRPIIHLLSASPRPSRLPRLLLAKADGRAATLASPPHLHLRASNKV